MTTHRIELTTKELEYIVQGLRLGVDDGELPEDCTKLALKLNDIKNTYSGPRVSEKFDKMSEQEKCDLFDNLLRKARKPQEA